jgi:hypothetical protein
MPTHYVNEAEITLPERGFVDRTVHKLESPLSGDDPLGVAVRRLPLTPGKSLRELVDGDVAANKAKLHGFSILDEAEVALAGAPAIVLRARWRDGEVAHYLLQAHVAFDDTWILIAVTGPYAERAACDEAFDRIVYSLEWRSSDAEGIRRAGASYQMNEAAFDLSGTFVDKTIHGLESKLPGGKALAVFVHRRPIEEEKGLRELVDENVALNEMRLHAYTVLDEAQADVGGLPGIVLRTRWRLGGETFYQRLVHVALEGKLMIFAVSAPLDERDACDETFDSILRTITWHTG